MEDTLGEWLGWDLPIGSWAESGVRWLLALIPWLWDFISTVLEGANDGLVEVLTFPPSIVLIALFAVIGWVTKGWIFALVTFVAFVVIDLTGLWELSMVTLSMVLVAVIVAALLAIPIGIVAARSRAVSLVVKPVLDLMQTMPALVYVILAQVFFGLGVVPGMVATIIFAMPPGIRLTELGIRQVDPEVVEAGHAFGSSPRKILWQIQLPLARPTIMAGINQVIMLSLSMVVLAGFVGAPGLGQSVVEGLSRGRPAFSIEAGLAIVILAIFLDRVTATLGTRSRTTRPAKTPALMKTA